MSGLAARRPEWRGWLRLLEETERALGDPAWERTELRVRAGEPEPVGATAGDGPRGPTGAPAARAPLLAGSELRLDGPAFRSHLARLLELAGASGGQGVAALAELRLDVRGSLALLEATLRSDRRRIAGTAGGGAGADAAATVAGLAALPPLHACWRGAASRLAAGRAPAWCPLCGAWPALVELRGLDRARVLRCGRCGGAWELPWLVCAFCGESRHDRLGSLVPEGEEETRRVETCASCRGYLKSLTALRESPPAELLLRDLETVELDLAATERGWKRPPAPGVSPDVTVHPLGADRAEGGGS